MHDILLCLLSIAAQFATKFPMYDSKWNKLVVQTMNSKYKERLRIN